MLRMAIVGCNNLIKKMVYFDYYVKEQLLKEISLNGYYVEILLILLVTAILCGIQVINNKNPILAVLSLIGLFGSISIYLILIGLTFIGLSYIIIYLGAVKNLVALIKIQLYKILFNNFIYLFICSVFFRTSCGHNKFNKSGPWLRKQARMSLLKNYYSTSSKIGGARGLGLVPVPVGFSVTTFDPEFIKWFVGFCDGESNFCIVFNKDKSGNIIGATFRFIIELHKDDKNTLEYIKSKLNIGNIKDYANSSKLTVIHKNDIYILISIFDKYQLNTTKFLDYLDFKEAFLLYNKRVGLLRDINLINKLVDLKNRMNNNRTNFTYPDSHNITISRSWLLGLIEGEGRGPRGPSGSGPLPSASFYLERDRFIPVFQLSLTEIQLPVIEKIKEYLEINLVDFEVESGDRCLQGKLRGT